MPGYVLGDVEWIDETGRRQYIELLGPTLEKFGGEFVAGTRQVRVVEGDWLPAGVLVLIRFESLAAAIDWYESPDYRPARLVREKAARSRMLIFEGG